MENILHKKSVLRTIVMFFSSLMLATILAPTGAVLAQENNNNSEYEPPTEEEIEQLAQEAAEELELYFGKIGRLDEDGNYQIVNPELLKEEANTDNKEAQALYQMYLENEGESVQPFGVGDFVSCTLQDNFSWAINLINGNTLVGLTEALASGAWSTAGNILATALAQASAVAGRSINIAFATASLAVSAYNCRSAW